MGEEELGGLVTFRLLLRQTPDRVRERQTLDKQGQVGQWFDLLGRRRQAALSGQTTSACAARFI